MALWRHCCTGRPVLGQAASAMRCVCTRTWPIAPSHRPRLNPRLCRSDKRLVAIAYGISNGMRFLHKNHICHRDLKSHNVLYDKQLNIKLCDFAFSKFKATLEKKSVRFESRVGTPQWMAPEVLRGEEYTFSAGQIPPFPHPAGQIPPLPSP